MPLTTPPLHAFISYSTLDKEFSEKVKSALSALRIQCFLAHEDIRISEEWKKRILDELSTCEVFVPLLSRNFKLSEWGPQELGFALGKGALIIPVSLDETLPFGLISHLQGLRLPSDVSPNIFVDPIAQRFPRAIIRMLIDRMAGAKSFRQAEALMKPLVPLFQKFSDEEINAFTEASIKNGEIWDATDCRREYLPQFIEMHRDRVAPRLLRALEYQIEFGRPYQGEEDDPR